MSEITLDPRAEAASILLAIAPSARSKGERRYRAWIKLQRFFSFHRVCEIDRQSSRIVLTAEEMKLLREAAKTGGASERGMAERIERLEAELQEVREFRARMEATLVGVEGGQGGQKSPGRNQQFPGASHEVVEARRLGSGAEGRGD